MANPSQQESNKLRSWCCQTSKALTGNIRKFSHLMTVDHTTTHSIYEMSSVGLPELEPDSAELLVTSPPYPMVEMWDDVFSAQSEHVKSALDDDLPWEAYDAMHAVLDGVWVQCGEVLVEGGLACINIGPATRRYNGRYRYYPNPETITKRFVEHGFDPLPPILWRKPTNSAAKYMGSGMKPPNAYPTLEHEYILIFRNGERRTPPTALRNQSAYFYEERNEWFSDLWTGITGERQDMDAGGRDRSAAFPIEIPRRLVQMFSVQTDTVLDPFLGTGTTTLVGMMTGRNTVGYEIDSALVDEVAERVCTIRERTENYYEERLQAHQQAVMERTDSGTPPKYDAENYGVAVTSSDSTGIVFPTIESVNQVGDDPMTWEIEHGMFSADSALRGGKPDLRKW